MAGDNVRTKKLATTIVCVPQRLGDAARMHEKVNSGDKLRVKVLF